MKLLLFSFLVAAASASPLLGTDHCTWGPSYWCSHIKAAKECNAVQHCISTVWKNQKLPAVTDENCDFCKFMIEEVASALKNNATQKEVLEILEKACSVIPDANMSAECKKTVDKYVPEIIQLILAELDPKVICTALGFCPGGFNLKPKAGVQGKPLDNILGHVQLIKTQTKAKLFVPEEADRTHSSDEYCALCKVVIGEIRNMDNDKDKQQEIEQFIEKYLCGNLGKEKDECDKLVTEYGPIIFNFLAREMDPETICRAIGMCTSMKKKPLVSLLKEKNGVQTMSQVPMQLMTPAIKKDTRLKASPECILCEYVISELEGILKDNATEEEIVEAVEKICSYLPSSVSKECDALVQKYGQLIIKLLVNEADPKTICSFIGACPPSKRVPKFDFGSEGCVLCQTVVMYMQALLKENSTEVVIRHELERVCNFLPDTEAAVCDGLVLMYAEKLIQAFVNKISAKDICQFIRLCPKSKTYSEPKNLKPLKMDVKSNELCVLCEFVVKELDDLLKKNSTEQEIEALLDKICSLMPSTVEAECDDFVKQYGPIVVQLLATELNPQMICTAIGACKSSKASVKKVASEEECKLCTLVAGYLDAMLSKKATKAEIEAALEKVCGYLPNSIKTECDDLVKQYSSQIIDLLIKEMSPSAICKELGLCPAKKASPKLLGSEKCTYGPSYWCINFDNAKKCNAVEHCNKHVWKNELP